VIDKDGDWGPDEREREGKWKVWASRAETARYKQKPLPQNRSWADTPASQQRRRENKNREARCVPPRTPPLLTRTARLRRSIPPVLLRCSVAAPRVRGVDERLPRRQALGGPPPGMASVGRSRSRRRGEGGESFDRNGARPAEPAVDHHGPCSPALVLSLSINHPGFCFLLGGVNFGFFLETLW
jgi:hypothetical protein